MDLHQFNNKLEELRQKFASPQVVEGNFTQGALRNFCIDLADFINGILPFLHSSFASFYNRISCTISGDQIHEVIVLSNNSCPDLLPPFEHLNPPASIQLNFTLSNSSVPGWLAIHKDLFLHLRPEGFELLYDNPIGDEVPIQKNYNSNLLDVGQQLLDRLSDHFLTVIENRIDPV